LSIIGFLKAGFQTCGSRKKNDTTICQIDKLPNDIFPKLAKKIIFEKLAITVAVPKKCQNIYTRAKFVSPKHLPNDTYNK